VLRDAGPLHHTPCLIRRSNISYGVPVLQPVGLPTPAHDAYSSPALVPALLPPYTAVSPTQHRNYSTLPRFAVFSKPGLSTYVTDCNTTASGVAQLSTLAASAVGANVADALVAYNVSNLFARGYPRSDDTYVDFLGGNIYILRPWDANLFNTAGRCQLWAEPLVEVATDEHWLTFTGANFAARFEAAGRAAVVAMIDGIALPMSSVRVRDHELVEVLLPAFVGRRRLQLDVNGVRSNALVLVNAKPVVHGFMEWRLGVEDVRGVSPASENTFTTSILDGDAGWGGFGAWEQPNKCMKVSLSGFHFGSADDLAAARLLVYTLDRPCELTQVPRHVRVTCCARYPSTPITVYVGGQRSVDIIMSASVLVRKPVVTVRRRRAVVDVCGCVSDAYRIVVLCCRSRTARWSASRTARSRWRSPATTCPRTRESCSCPRSASLWSRPRGTRSRLAATTTSSART
jgi:hypothetical protein